MKPDELFEKEWKIFESECEVHNSKLVYDNSYVEVSNEIRTPNLIGMKLETRNLKRYRKRHELNWADNMFLENDVNIKLPEKLIGTKDEKYYN